MHTPGMTDTTHDHDQHSVRSMAGSLGRTESRTFGSANVLPSISRDVGASKASLSSSSSLQGQKLTGFGRSLHEIHHSTAMLASTGRLLQASQMSSSVAALGDLLSDDAFVESLNAFLSLPAFSRRTMYVKKLGIICDASSLVQAQLHLKEHRPGDATVVAAGFDWFEKERLPYFLVSDYFILFVLGQLLSVTRPDCESLRHRLGMAEFAHFLRRTSGERDFLFWVEAERYRLCACKKQRKIILDVICERFLADGAALELSGPARDKAAQVASTSSVPEMLRAVQEVSVENLVGYWLPRFLSDQAKIEEEEYAEDSRQEPLKKDASTVRQARIADGGARGIFSELQRHTQSTYAFATMTPDSRRQPSSTAVSASHSHGRTSSRHRQRPPSSLAGSVNTAHFDHHSQQLLSYPRAPPSARRHTARMRSPLKSPGKMPRLPRLSSRKSSRSSAVARGIAQTIAFLTRLLPVGQDRATALIPQLSSDATAGGPLYSYIQRKCTEEDEAAASASAVLGLRCESLDDYSESMGVMPDPPRIAANCMLFWSELERYYDRPMDDPDGLIRMSRNMYCRYLAGGAVSSIAFDGFYGPSGLDRLMEAHPATRFDSACAHALRILAAQRDEYVARDETEWESRSSTVKLLRPKIPFGFGSRLNPSGRAGSRAGSRASLEHGSSHSILEESIGGGTRKKHRRRKHDGHLHSVSKLGIMETEHGQSMERIASAKSTYHEDADKAVGGAPAVTAGAEVVEAPHAADNNNGEQAAAVAATPDAQGAATTTDTKTPEEVHAPLPVVEATTTAHVEESLTAEASSVAKPSKECLLPIANEGATDPQPPVALTAPETAPTKRHRHSIRCSIHGGSASYAALEAYSKGHADQASRRAMSETPTALLRAHTGEESDGGLRSRSWKEVTAEGAIDPSISLPLTFGMPEDPADGATVGEITTAAAEFGSVDFTVSGDSRESSTSAVLAKSSAEGVLGDAIGREVGELSNAARRGSIMVRDTESQQLAHIRSPDPNAGDGPEVDGRRHSVVVVQQPINVHAVRRASRARKASVERGETAVADKPYGMYAHSSGQLRAEPEEESDADVGAGETDDGEDGVAVSNSRGDVAASGSQEAGAIVSAQEAMPVRRASKFKRTSSIAESASTAYAEKPFGMYARRDGVLSASEEKLPAEAECTCGHSDEEGGYSTGSSESESGSGSSSDSSDEDEDEGPGLTLESALEDLTELLQPANDPAIAAAAGFASAESLLFAARARKKPPAAKPAAPSKETFDAFKDVEVEKPAMEKDMHRERVLKTIEHALPHPKDARIDPSMLPNARMFMFKHPSEQDLKKATEGRQQRAGPRVAFKSDNPRLRAKIRNMWRFSIRCVLNCRAALMLDKGTSRFRDFVRESGLVLETEFEFWQEVERYKFIKTCNWDVLVGLKILAIFDCFLESVVPPAVQINISEEIFRDMAARRYVRPKSLFGRAQTLIFDRLLQLWPPYSRYDNDLAARKEEAAAKRALKALPLLKPRREGGPRPRGAAPFVRPADVADLQDLFLHLHKLPLSLRPVGPHVMTKEGININDVGKIRPPGGKKGGARSRKNSNARQAPRASIPDAASLAAAIATLPPIAGRMDGAPRAAAGGQK